MRESASFCSIMENGYMYGGIGKDVFDDLSILRISSFFYFFLIYSNNNYLKNIILENNNYIWEKVGP